MSGDEARRLLRELLPEVLGELQNGNGRNGGDPAPVPRIPAPPTAAVLRPSTWDRPPAPGEIIGNGAAAAPAEPPAAPPPEPAATPPEPAGTRDAEGTEQVDLRSDEDLDRFVRRLLTHFENPRDRMAIRAGKLRFTLRHPAAAPAAGAAIRVERGAVTERRVAEAARQGARLVLAPAAVLTPLARERARALGVEIEREKRC